MLDDLQRTWSVVELSRAIERTLEDRFPDDVWVQGEIANLSRARNGHVYFDLIDPSDEAGKPALAALSVALFKMNKDVVNRLLKRAGNIRIEDGMKVRIRGVVTWYPRNGRLQLRMTSIDPTFIIGQLAADRDRVLRVLAAEGLLDANRGVLLPPTPLRIGLLTSAGSAAYHDFVHELELSGLHWHVHLVDVQVQGVKAADAVCRGLRTLEALDVDVVALVRGGGARTELAAFDAESIARTIAALAVPVITGIGHEIDRSVADEVAHASFKTPTACAQALVGLVRDHLARSEAAWAGIVAAAQVALRAADDDLVERADRSARATRAVLSVHEERHRHLAARIARETRGTLRRHDLELAERRRALAGRSTRPLREASRAVDRHRESLARRADRALAHAERVLAAADATSRANDPRRAMARGWSITRRADGTVVRDAASLAPGDEVVTQFARGSATSAVVAVRADDDRGAGDPAGTGSGA